MGAVYKHISELRNEQLIDYILNELDSDIYLSDKHDIDKNMHGLVLLLYRYMVNYTVNSELAILKLGKLSQFPRRSFYDLIGDDYLNDSFYIALNDESSAIKQNVLNMYTPSELLTFAENSNKKLWIGVEIQDYIPQIPRLVEYMLNCLSGTIDIPLKSTDLQIRNELLSVISKNARYIDSFERAELFSHILRLDVVELFDNPEMEPNFKSKILKCLSPYMDINNLNAKMCALKTLGTNTVELWNSNVDIKSVSIEMEF